MKLAYLIPDNQYSFFGEVVPYLSKSMEVVVNRIDKDADMILVGILPITHSWLNELRNSSKPIILWHWDLYSFTNLTEPRWVQFFDLMDRAVDIWSCTYETARQLKELRGLDSYIMPAWVNSKELAWSPDKNYAFYATASGGFGKRVEWAKKACELLGLDLVATLNQRLPRSEYLKLLSECRVYLMTAFEESNATIPAQEAGACGKPVVLADLPASREVFGDTAFYFPPADFRGLLKQFDLAWQQSEPIASVRERIVTNYDLPVVAKRMTRRLKEVFLCLTTDPD